MEPTFIYGSQLYYFYLINQCVHVVYFICQSQRLWACIKYNERECVHIVVFFICQSQRLWACIKYNERECVHIVVFFICQSQILWVCIRYNEREPFHLIGIMGCVLAHYIDFEISRSTFFSSSCNFKLDEKIDITDNRKCISKQNRHKKT